MDKSQIEYVKRMIPIGQKIQSKTGLPAELTVAWMTWETDFGKNQTTKVRNQSGIGAASSGKDFVAGGYAGYNSDDSYIADYVRTITARDYRGYGAVIDAAKRNPKDYVGITQKHNDSKWSEDPYNTSTIAVRANQIAAMMGVSGGVPATQKKTVTLQCPHCSHSLVLSEQ